MNFRDLGKTGLRVSELGFGCARIASLSTPHSRAEVAATVREALERSITIFDTADVYGQGDSERLLGKLLRGHRDRVVICTKAGLTLRAPQRLVRWVKPVLSPLLRRSGRGRRAAASMRERSERQCFEPDYIRRRIEGSLRRLKVDHLDVFLLHNPPAEVIARGELTDVLDALRRAGAIRHYGISCREPADVETAVRIGGISCLQLELNPLMMSSRAEASLRLARGANLGIIAREPLAGGALVDSPVIQQICKSSPVARTPAEVALKYALARGDADVVLIGMTCRRHLRENLAALTTPQLSDDELARISLLHPAPEQTPR